MNPDDGKCDNPDCMCQQLPPPWKATEIDMGEVVFNNPGPVVWTNEMVDALPNLIVCECGAEKAQTTHAHWCPKFSGGMG